MNVTEPVARQATVHPLPRTSKEWLDALSGGACDQQAFFGAVDARVQDAPDDGWDLLGLVDQYYRRGKIGAELFGVLKTHLQTLLVGNGTHVEMSVPMAPAATVAVAAHDAPWVDATVAVPTPDLPTADLPRGDLPTADVPMADFSTADEPTVVPATVVPATVVPATVVPAAVVPAAVVPAASVPAAVPAAAHAATVEPRTPAVGDLLRGRYRVQGLLGRGGMGTVFAALDQYRLEGGNGEQRVALKILHTEVLQRPRLFAELRREFQHLQSLSHPNVVRVHEFDRDGDLAFFTMEYLSGAVLTRVLAANASAPMRLEYALAVIRDVGAAIVHAHSRGVVHGDLNPANVFITDTGEVRVLDFGASHQLHRGPWISDFGADRPVAVATLSYASCQVLEGEVADARDDVYALACIIYRLIAGVHPFRDETAQKARASRLSAPRPPGLDRRQWRDLRLGLRFDRERRPTDVRAWLNRLNLRGAVAVLPGLHTLLTDRPRRRSAAPTVALGVALIVAATGWWTATHLDIIENTASAVGTRLRSLGGTDSGFAPIANPPSANPPSANPPIANAPIRPAAAPQQPSAGSVQPLKAPGVTVRAPAVRPPVVARAPAELSINPGQTGRAGRALIELSSDNVEIARGEPTAAIPIHRTRNLRDDVTFKWWTESGTAKPGQDFVPMAPRVEHLQPGQSSVNLAVPLVADPSRHVARNFYVVIDQEGDSNDVAAVGPRTLTMVTIPAPVP